jgi:hypothetical protein
MTTTIIKIKRDFRTKRRRADAVIGIDPVEDFYRRYRAHIEPTSEQVKLVRTALIARTLGNYPDLAEFANEYGANADFYVARHLIAEGKKSHGLAWMALAASLRRCAAGIFALYLNDEYGKLKKIRAKACLQVGSTSELFEYFMDAGKDLYEEFLTDKKTKIFEDRFRYSTKVLAQKLMEPSDRDLRATVKLHERLLDPIELRAANKNWASKLVQEFPWFDTVVERLETEQLLRARSKHAWHQMRPLLLNGPPGIGKSAFVRAYSKAIGLPSLYVSLGGEVDARGIAGTARGWGSTTPSIIVQAMTNHECANPIVFVDELEKAGGSRRNGDVKATLLAMLERDTARNWFDPCLQAPIDLSHINWIAGTNTLDGIPDALLSRFDVVQCEAPTVEDWPIIRTNMLRNIADGLGIDVCDLPKIDAAIDREIARLLARGDMRPARRALEQCIGLAAQAEENVLPAPRMN